MIRKSNMLQSLFQFSIIAIVFCNIRCGICLDTDTITSSVVLRDQDTIRSATEQFTLGFFSPNGTNNRYMGIWFDISPKSIAWVANRDHPINDSSGTIAISSDGNLVLTNGNREILWSTNVTTDANTTTNKNTTVQLLDSGNLVLRDSLSGDTIWESLMHPTDTFLPTMRLFHNPRTGERRVSNSWRTFNDPGRGNFTSGLNATGVPQLYIWDQNGAPMWRSGPWNGRSFTGITGMYSVYVDGFTLGIEEDGTYYFTRSFRRRFVSRNYLHADGVLSEAGWDDVRNDWNVRWRAPINDCDRYNYCGPFAVCYVEDSPICSCLRGYEARDRGEWDRGVWSGGCVKKTPLQCERDANATDRNRADGFSKLTRIKVPDFLQWSSSFESECRGLCLMNCSCLAYAFESGIGCMFWNETLIDVQKFLVTAGSDFYVRVAYSELDEQKVNKVVIVVSVIASVVAASFCILLAWLICKRKGRNDPSAYEKGVLYDSSGLVLRGDMGKVNIEELPMYSFEILAAATNNFDKGNKLGTGGFGSVYKGKLADGREIAVKRLSAASEQGFEEFTNEVVVISKLQHRNLVRLIGCCVDREEKMLIYEYLQKKSLDVFLFDKPDDVLDWQKRFNIMEGIGRGLLYLHRDSRLRIIHRDLKPSNILLDENWNPKISDFGMARIFGGNQDQANTRKVVGTYGYMAPEYAIGGRFSEKSDVFSFGVLVLEIISGRRNTSFYNDVFSLGLLGYAWKLWNEDNVAYLIDEGISSPVYSEEITRCVHIGLLCVQECAKNRPAISTVLSMLSSEIVELPVPEHPGYTERWIHSPNGSPSRNRTSSVNDLTHTVLEGR